MNYKKMSTAQMIKRLANKYGIDIPSDADRKVLIATLEQLDAEYDAQLNDALKVVDAGNNGDGNVAKMDPELEAVDPRELAPQRHPNVDDSDDDSEYEVVHVRDEPHIRDGKERRLTYIVVESMPAELLALAKGASEGDKVCKNSLMRAIRKPINEWAEAAGVLSGNAIGIGINDRHTLDGYPLTLIVYGTPATRILHFVTIK